MLGKKKAEEGAPAWVLTYGDMMSLLLCFFILLAAFADYDRSTPSPNMIRAIQSMQEALGLKVAGNTMNDQVDFNALIDKLREAIQTGEDKFKGDISQFGIQGESFRLRRIRDGMEITLGGPILFEPFADTVTLEGRKTLEQIGSHLKGHRNKIEIRGHAGD
ncbi:MAG TPA: flagellar motor protein MotB, partial [Phycisphaerae bacterium]|nr:flagellar motor protein MotB [Phycisphaerae bacterium]